MICLFQLKLHDSQALKNQGQEVRDQLLYIAVSAPLQAEKWAESYSRNTFCA